MRGQPESAFLYFPTVLDVLVVCYWTVPGVTDIAAAVCPAASSLCDRACGEQQQLLGDAVLSLLSACMRS